MCCAFTRPLVSDERLQSGLFGVREEEGIRTLRY